jgi:hypothetical protein
MREATPLVQNLHLDILNKPPWWERIELLRDLGTLVNSIELDKEQEVFLPNFEGPPPADVWDKQSARRALDDLFRNAQQYTTSDEFRQLIEFIARFRFYSPFNAMLIHTQMTGAHYVAPAYRWANDHKRRVKTGARPIAILQPMGPIMFVFDVADTEPLPNAPPLPSEIECPFEVHEGKIGAELSQTIENCKRDGINAIENKEGAQSAGSIRYAEPGYYLEVTVRLKPEPRRAQVPRRYDMIINSICQLFGSIIPCLLICADLALSRHPEYHRRIQYRALPGRSGQNHRRSIQ